MTSQRLAGDDIECAAKTIRADEILEHIAALAGDRFEGRCPGTIGEERTLDYLEQNFSRLGLKSFAGGKPYFQAVPLVGCLTQASLVIGTENGLLSPATPADFMIISRKLEEQVVTRSELVFVGYGVDAPEYSWNDFKDADLKGKTLVVLVGDPPVKLADRPDALDPDMFNGPALTYYGRWTCKFEAAAARGAVGALIVHETREAGYPFEVVRNTWAGERFELGCAPEPGLCHEGWLSYEFACELFAHCGMDFAAMKAAACDREFQPVPMRAAADCRLQCTMRSFDSYNCIGYIEGSDAELKNEAVMYIAHWDHFGPDQASGGQQFFSGAVDNGSGVGCLLAIARAFAALKTPPKRSIIFLSPTAEEHNLLGAKHYVAHEPFPLANTVAVINMDCMNVWGRTGSIISVLSGKSTLDDKLSALAHEQGRRVLPDQAAEKGFTFRSDHFEMMRKGVPSLLFLQPGADYVGQKEDLAQQLCDQYISCHYHKVTDKVSDSWDLSGTVQDSQLLFKLGLAVANDRQRPLWLEGATKGMGFSSS